MVILGFDGLEPSLVEKWKMKDLQQSSWGVTDLSDFKLLRTVSLWASFLAGRHIEDEISNKDLWNYSLAEEESLFKFFKSYKAIDVPAFSYKKEPHWRERELLKRFFADDSSDGQEIIEEYDRVCWQNHGENKKEFFEALSMKHSCNLVYESNNRSSHPNPPKQPASGCKTPTDFLYDLVFGYFSLTDTIAHLSFGDEEKMHKVYEEAVRIVVEAKFLRTGDQFLIISDHGMKSVGRFGDHAPNGFWSKNWGKSLGNPRITAFSDLIVESSLESK